LVKSADEIFLRESGIFAESLILPTVSPFPQFGTGFANIIRIRFRRRSFFICLDD
jgi:hypothetical protein